MMISMIGNEMRLATNSSHRVISAIRLMILPRAPTVCRSFQLQNLRPIRRHFVTSRPSRSATLSNPSRSPSPSSLQSQPLPTSTSTESEKSETITISPRAAHRLLQILRSDRDPTLCLRVTVTSGGCHGFQYLISLAHTSGIQSGEDMVFTAPDPETVSDESPEKGEEVKARVVMDEPSFELLKGSTIDYTTELIGSQFKVVGNPRAKSSCGCGTSFDVEE